MKFTVYIIRGFKFAHRLGFTLDEHTKQLQDDYLLNIRDSVFSMVIDILNPEEQNSKSYNISFGKFTAAKLCFSKKYKL